jgi:adenosylcobinamide-GDP ribazoletransferase
MLFREIKTFLTALTYFSRIPAPNFEFKQEYLKNSGRYFSSIGILIGSLSFLAYFATAQLLPPNISIIISIIFSVLLTGAFHEDGLADMADGIGGGWTKVDKLKIMKDSRIGTYGSSALILLFLLKLNLLLELTHIVDSAHLFLIFICSHSLSRTTAGALIFFLPYVQEESTSKAKPVAHMSLWSLSVLTFVGIAPILIFQSLDALLIIPGALLTGLFMGRFLKKTLGGITGDCLGGAQQITELVCLITFVIIFR